MKKIFFFPPLSLVSLSVFSPSFSSVNKSHEVNQGKRVFQRERKRVEEVKERVFFHLFLFLKWAIFFSFETQNSNSSSLSLSLSLSLNLSL